MPSRLTRYFHVLCCLGTPDGGLSRPLGSRSDTHACRGALSIGEAERVDYPQRPVFRVVECPHSSLLSPRKAKDRLTPVPPVTIADCSSSHDVSSPSRGENGRIDCPQLPVFRTFPSPFSSRTPLRLTPSTNRQYNQSSPPPRREAEDQLTPVPLATTTDRPPYHSDAPSPSKKETEQVDHSQHPVFQTFSDPSSSRAPFPIPSINRQYNPSLPPPQKNVDGPAGEAEMRMNETAKVRQLLDLQVNRGLIEQVAQSTVEVINFALGIPPASSRGHPTTRANKYAEFTEFVTSVIERAEVIVSDILVALVYIQRARPYLSIQTEDWALHRVFLGALIVASKYTNNSTLKNIHWATVSGTFGKRDVGRIEREFIEVLDWDFAINEADLLLIRKSLLHLIPSQSPTTDSDSSEPSHWNDDESGSDSR